MQFSVSKIPNSQAQASTYEKHRRLIIARLTGSIEVLRRTIAGTPKTLNSVKLGRAGTFMKYLASVISNISTKTFNLK